ncbi:MAG: HEPN domain-containing protein [Nanoarchaeota archaeon]|nr:HEPN domain-containing protein [Nanoarchaeota archaeon]
MMTELPQEEFNQNLKNLVSKIKQNVDYGKKTGLIIQKKIIVRKWIASDFKYNENGVDGLSMEGQEIEKDSWDESIGIVLTEIEKTEEYKFLSSKLPQTFNFDLWYFCRKLIFFELKGELTEDLLKRFEEDAFKAINGESIGLVSDVAMEGIIVLTDKASFKILNLEISIRQVKKEDVEAEISLDSWFYPRINHLRNPSAYLRVVSYGVNQREAQNNVQKIITILRLFRVGSARYLSYKTSSLSEALPGMGVTSTIREFFADKRYVLRDWDIVNLKKFLENMFQVLPTDIFSWKDKQEDYAQISYERYSEALLEGGSEEKRVANLIMSLESIFLRRDDVTDLSFKLRNRIAKVFSKLGFNPLTTRKLIGAMYHVRSLYVHGGILSYEGRKEFTERYGQEVSKFLEELYEYVRISIVIMLLSSRGKIAFIDLIDDAFIDKNKDEELERIIQSIRTSIPISTTEAK